MFDTHSLEFIVLLVMAGALFVTFAAVGVLVRTAAAVPQGVRVAGRFDSRTGR